VRRPRCATAARVTRSRRPQPPFERYPGDIGVILLHGKWGPTGAPTIALLTWAFHDDGYKVEAQFMPWPGVRLYDKIPATGRRPCTSLPRSM